MDELLNKLIEVDKSARRRVTAAKKGKSAALEALEAKKEELRKVNEEKYSQQIEKENAKQTLALEKSSKEIEKNYRETVDALKKIYEEKCGEWVNDIVAEVTK